MASLKRLTLKGFKSIESLVDFELRPVNVLIGANGAGKSNVVDFFRMAKAMACGALQRFALERGGADGFLHLGPKHTPEISARLEFGVSDAFYEFTQSTTTAGNLLIGEEKGGWSEPSGSPVSFRSQTILESKMADWSRLIESPGPHIRIGWRAPFLRNLLADTTIYHFHDTTFLAGMRREQSVRDFDYLREDGSNIAPFLLRLREETRTLYDFIRDVVRQVAPFFDDFALRPEMKGPAELVRLEWRQKGTDYRFQPWQLSDGLIRFICLATALLPPTLPALIVIDEPELGLHPSALTLVGEMIHSAATRAQLLIATQSPRLVDQFEPAVVVVVDREQGRSLFRRLNEDELADWLTDYSLGELWEKGVLQGAPHSE